MAATAGLAELTERRRDGFVALLLLDGGDQALRGREPGVVRLGEALGANAATFMGMAGLGDLVLTCTDNQSRNRRFGLALGKGCDVDTAQTEIGQVVEGYRNTKEVYTLAKRLGVEMPITEQIYQVLYQGKSPVEAAKELLSRDKKSETPAQ